MDSFTIEMNGMRFVVQTEHDDCMGEPWKEHDGHGVVSDWTRRDKRPSERVLNTYRGIKRYYDFAESMKIARREGWGCGEVRVAELTVKKGAPLTRGEITAAAVEQDFEYLRAWCNDEWEWVSIIVRDAEGNVIDSLGGVDSYDEAYVRSEAQQMVEAYCASRAREDREREYWAERDVLTV